MSTGKTNPFSAIDASLGYLYQVRSALLWALRRMKVDPDFLVSIETLDDVTFETAGHIATELLQTKHHLSRVASLSDACPDLWRTLRVWCEGYATSAIPLNACLFLVTTGTVSVGSAASYLRADARDVGFAQRALDATAAASTSQANTAAYAAYLRASALARTAILDRVTIIDNAPTITDLDSQLKGEVFWAAEKQHHVAFLERLEGWWLRRVLVQLVNAAKDRIGSGEIEDKMADLREQFKQGSLPIDDDILEFVLDDAAEADYLTFNFVRQLGLIQAGKRRVAAAIRDYYRAFEQRSRWLRDDLIGGLDLDKYENRLAEEWELIFEAMRDELGEAAADDAKLQAARSVLAWAERSMIPIRPYVTEPFLTRGSLHMLADDIRIGWHPDFREHLSELLSRRENET